MHIQLRFESELHGSAFMRRRLGCPVCLQRGAPPPVHKDYFEDQDGKFFEKGLKSQRRGAVIQSKLAKVAVVGNKELLVKSENFLLVLDKLNLMSYFDSGGVELSKLMAASKELAEASNELTDAIRKDLLGEEPLYE